MAVRKKQMTFWVTVEERQKINFNAKAFGLGAGTYLRLLGLSGGNPFTTQLAEGARRPVPIVTEVRTPQEASEESRKQRRRSQ